MNIFLFCKWWWKLENNVGSWQEIIQAKYVHNRQTALIHHRQTNSTCWADLLKVKHFYLKNKHMRVGNGEATSL
jgi:hypothetical protein